MNKLLRADFARLFRKKAIIIEVIFTAVLAAFEVLTYYLDGLKYDAYPAGEEILFSGGIYVAVQLAILIPSFIGTEYADKTIRNKLIVGHNKAKVFISNMITMLVASTILMTVWNVVSGVLSQIVIGYEKPFRINALILFEEYIAILTLTAIIVTLAMFITSKTASAVIILCAFFGFLIYSISITQRLAAPEYYTVYSTEEGAFVDIDDEYLDEASLEAIKSTLIEEEVPNPTYISEGFYRTYLETAGDVLVTSQLMDLTGAFNIDLIWYVVFDNAVILVLTFGGALIYRRKEIS